MKSFLLLLTLAVSSGSCFAQNINPLFEISVDLRRGFIDKTGEIVITPQFFDARDFSEGLAAVKNDKNQWGYIDEKGRMAVKFQYASAGDFSEGVARIQIEGTDHWNGLIGYIDKSGMKIIKPQFIVKELTMPEFGFFLDGLAVFEKDGKMGFIDKAGKIVIEPTYDIANSFKGGLAGVTNGYKSGFIDKSGRVVIPLIYGYGTVPEFAEGLARVTLNDENFFINRYDKEVMRHPTEPDISSFPSNFSEGLASWIFASGKVGYVNTRGEVAIPPLFDSAEDFFEGLAAVEVDGKYGFIDQTGTIVIEPQHYLYLPKFINGLARVTTYDFKFKYIDRTGKIIWKEID